MIAIAAMIVSGAVAAQQPSTNPSSQSVAPQGPQTQKGFTGELRSGVWSGETFSRLDTNRDGMISREEAQAEPTIREAWGRLDAKNAGRVSRADFDKYGASQPASGTQPNFNSAGPVPSTGTAPKK